MNSNAALWVSALESDTYARGRGALRKEECYCPMGVGCDVYRRETGEGYWHPVSDGALVKYYAFVLPEDVRPEQGEYSVLPARVRRWLGLRSSTGSWGCWDGVPGKLIGACAGSITALNDTGEGDVWGKIIDIIKSEPRGLFIQE